MPLAPLTPRRRRLLFTREGFVNFVKNMAVTVILTALIWIYAEREQPTNNAEIIFPLHVHADDPSRTSALLTPADGNVMVTLSGPKARLDQVREQLSGGDFPRGLDLAVNRPPGVYDPPAAPLLSAQPLFRDLSVKSVAPDVLHIRTENLVDATATVSTPPDFPDMEAFNPQTRTVKLRGPESEMRVLLQHFPDGIPVYPRITKAELPPFGVPQTFTNVPLTLPDLPGVRDPRTTLSPDHDTIALTLKRADVTGVLPPVVVQPTAPRSLEDEYKVVLSTDTLRNVRVRGPRDAVERLTNNPDPDRPVTALLFYTRADIPIGSATRKPDFINLPPGVTIDDADRPEIRFSLVKRAPTE